MGRRSRVQLQTRLRVLFTSAAAVLTGLVHLIAVRGHEPGAVLSVGDQAPDFSLPGSDGRMYHLSSFRGQPVVLAWFPKAFTGGCTMECQSIGTNARRLRDLGAVCFALSVDSPDTNRDFAASLGLDFPVLSDASRRVARAYGVLGLGGFPSRWTFYVGVDGRIAAIDKDVRVRSHGTDIERMLGEQLQAGRA